MKFKMLLLTGLLGLFCSTTFALENTSTTPADNTSQAAPTANQDNDTVAWLMTLNKNEITLAKVVLKRKVNSDVKAYAQKMIKDHSKNLKDLVALSKKEKIQPDENAADVAALKQQGQDGLTKLTALTGKPFQIAYINAMAEGHAAALKGLDEKIQVTSDVDLKNYLEKTREKVTEHLNMANTVKTKID